MLQWTTLSLELGLLALALVLFVLDLTRVSRRLITILAGLGTFALFLFSFTVPSTGTFTQAFILDPFALFLKRIFLLAALLTLMGASTYARVRNYTARMGEFILLVLLATLGAMALVSARDFLTFFVAFELLSLPIYALAAIEKGNPLAPEGALKVFLFGSLSSVALFLGIGLLYAATGTTFWTRIHTVLFPVLFQLGVVLLLVGIGFKIAMFPFYMWVPDTYEAAPTPVVAFLSVAPKAAGIGVLFRLYFEFFSRWQGDLTAWITVLAAVTMIAGNLMALPQKNLKRLLAYSGVAHIGYVLTAVAAGSRFSAAMALFYFVAYLFSNMGAFLAVAALETQGVEPTLEGSRNLIRRSPLLAAAFLVFLLSLGGIPFVLGFWGKLYVFLAAGKAGLWGLVFLGALLAVIALYYYLNVARWMFIVEEGEGSLHIPGSLLAAVGIAAVVVFAGGLVPQWLVVPAVHAVMGF